MSHPPGLIRPPVKPSPEERERRFPPERTLWWGATKACPVCGKRGLFRRWFTMADRCSRCDMPFEREEGGYIGAIGTNSVLTEGALMASLALSMLVMAPEFPWFPLVAINLTVGLVAALFFYPISKTLWLSLSILANPPTIKEVRPEYLPGGLPPLVDQTTPEPPSSSSSDGPQPSSSP